MFVEREPSPGTSRNGVSGQTEAPPRLIARTRRRRRRELLPPVAQFAIGGLIAMAAVGVLALQIFHRVGNEEAIRDASTITRLAGKSIVAPALTPGILTRAPAAERRLDRVVRARVLSAPVFRVKLWDASGRILYSDMPQLAGERFPLRADELHALRQGTTDAEISDLSRPENRYEHGFGRVLEVYHGIAGPHGVRLLFETYQRYSVVSASGRRLWLKFAPVLLAGLLLLEIVQLPLAISLARRLRRGQREREGLLRRAVEASEHERHRIARDLHDGPVQNLAGVSFSLAAVEQELRADAPALAGTVEEAASGTRESIRELRSLVIDLFPPDLHRGGLAAAVHDLLAPLRLAGVAVELDVRAEDPMDEDLETVLFRLAQEALRNVSRHAEARNVKVNVTVDAEAAELLVSDDGRGFDLDEARSRGGGNVGLRVLEDVAAEYGGRARIDSSPGAGTRVEVRIPLGGDA